MGHLRRRYPDVDRIFVSFFFFFFCFCVFFCILRSQISRGRKQNHRSSFILRKMKVTIGCLALALFLTAWTEAAPRKKQHWEEMLEVCQNRYSMCRKRRDRDWERWDECSNRYRKCKYKDSHCKYMYEDCEKDWDRDRDSWERCKNRLSECRAEYTPK